jgi:alanine-synthesizing transaminase
VNLSRRTSWHRQQNKLTVLYENLRSRGKQIVDLTVSNPTKCGFDYSSILPPSLKNQSLIYNPDARGLFSARQSVAQYYREKNIIVDPENIFLTSGSSEAYSHIFKLLCNPGDTILVPQPSYPLFDYLAELNDVHLAYYNLNYDGEWHVDLASIATAIAESHSPVRAIILVHPHNPTGMFLKHDEYRSIKDITAVHDLALIVDEVFIDFPFSDDPRRWCSTTGETDVPIFTINGLSKSCGLPQMKLGWIVVGGSSEIVDEIVSRLEIICDTYLSVNIYAQEILPVLMQAGSSVRHQIIERTHDNYKFLVDTIGANNKCTVLYNEGGWYAIMRVPNTKSDELWSLELLENIGIYVQPGYFFDFPRGGYLILSLLLDQQIFKKSISGIVDHISHI